MNSEQLFIHKLDSIFKANIDNTFQDETGFYFHSSETDDWYKLNFSSADRKKVCEIEDIEYKDDFNF